MTTKTPTTPNFWGINSHTYLRTVPYRAHGKIELLGLQCMVARCLAPGVHPKGSDWAIIDVESGMTLGHWHHSKAAALTNVPAFLAAQTPRAIKHALESRTKTLGRMAKAAAAAEKAAKQSKA